MKTEWWKLLIVVVVVVVIAGVIASYMARRTDKVTIEHQTKIERTKRNERLRKQEADFEGPLDRVEIPATEAEFDEQCHAFFRRITVESYEKHGNKSIKWDAEATELLELTAAYLTHGEDEPTHKQLLAAAEKVMTTDCDDLVVSVAVGQALVLAGRPNEAIAHIHKADSQNMPQRYTVTAPDGSQRTRLSSGPVHSKYISFLKYLIVGTASGLIGGDEWNSMTASYDAAMTYLLSALSAEKMEPGDDRVIATWAMRAMGEQIEPNLDPFVASLSERTGLDLWVKEVLLGRAEILMAWKSRGSGWASTVTEEGWRGFKVHLGLARGHLVRAWELRPEYPEAPALMITVVGGGDVGEGETTRVWFDRAVAAQIDYMPAYDAHMCFLRPRWGGSHEAMYAFGEECAATGRYDTRVPHVLYSAAQAIAEHLYERGTDFWREPGVYSDVTETFKGMLAETDGPYDAEKTKTVWAAVAWRAGEYQEATRLLAELGDDVNTDALRGDFGATLRDIRGDIAVQTSSHAAAIAAALADGELNPGQAAATLAAIKNSLPGAEAKAWVQGKIVGMRVRQALTGTQWLDVTPDKDLAGWRVVAGEWRAEADGTITAMHDGRDTSLILTEPVQGNYEVRGVSLLPGKRALSKAGVYFEATMILGWTSASVFSYEAQSGDATLSGMSVIGRHAERAWILRENRFHIQVWESYVAAWLDDDLIFGGRQLREPEPPALPTHIGLGARSTAQEGVSAQYRKIEIRRLTNAPSWYAPPRPMTGQRPVSRPGYGDDG